MNDKFHRFMVNQMDEKMNNTNKKNNTEYKLSLFGRIFSGQTHVYGTYDPATGSLWQVKNTVTRETFFNHLKGTQPYGVYLLYGDRTRAIAVDFDKANPFPPVEFINSAAHYQLPAYLEISKSKGFHVWIFFNGGGVRAGKARSVVTHILEEIEYPQIEIFPKQDFLDTGTSYGNFINAPLFGKLVPSGKTVFIDPHTLKPYSDQWKFLGSIQRSNEMVLDEIIELNGLEPTHTQSKQSSFQKK